ncbi:hypothetical protein GLW04_19295 [Halobacillus litoralis]|uniref:Relaxase n=1 Tax=Halobacillus litoralis TaxID=45668 RepID=A0A845DWF0_9BACI|nr:MobP2 family relaxase [Halobacillus litoralis]MYL22023.1 hypothetical protein [Halobacillus litoralis]
MSLSTYEKASVIIKSRFIKGNQKRFNDYVNYMDRDEAKDPTDFSMYNNYMSDERKATSLFTSENSELSEDKKDRLKEAFKLSQERGSILWQDVVSFDNQWLEDHGMLDRRTGSLDENRLKDITRLAMKDMLHKGNINNNPVWSGAIHYNTDNVHIHLATVELSPDGNARGKRKLKTLENMKSVFVNKIMDRSKEHEQINDIIRNKIVNDKKQHKTFGTFNRTFKKDFLEIYHALPENRRYWNYGYEKINHIKPKLNQLIKDYMEKNYKAEYQNFEDRLDKEVEVLRKAYGEGDHHRYKDYKQNKIDDLYKRMGNAFLKEMIDYDKKVTAFGKGNRKYTPKMKQVKKNYAFHQMKYGVDRLMYSELNNTKNQAAYERLQRDMEREGSL